MNSLLSSLTFWGRTVETLPASSVWIRVANVLCVLGAAAAALSAFLDYRGWRGLAPVGGRRAGWGMIGLLVSAIGAMAITIANRWVEVHHFPSQTMSEVIQMFAFALLVSMFVMHFALNFRQYGFGWAIAGDFLCACILLGAFLANHYSLTLTTAQRDLPPALQSYWFAPHLSALIFSYATLGIAGAITLKYFCIRFWAGVFRGGWSSASQVVIVSLLLLVPYVQIIAGPVLLSVGVVFLTLFLRGKLPTREQISDLEARMDAISYRAFSVGIPFLTAGLFMGAFWAQEAWANYWGWDSKENSALITWLVYVGYIHLRMLGGYRGEKAMAVLLGGALSVFLTFQVFGYLPDSQKSLHRYTDDGVVPKEGMQGVTAASVDEARLETDR